MMLEGKVDLNKALIISDRLCPRNHVINSKSIRYKSGDACAICVAFNRQQGLHKKLSVGAKIHNKAIKKFEDIEYQRELKRIESEDF